MREGRGGGVSAAVITSAHSVKTVERELTVDTPDT